MKKKILCLPIILSFVFVLNGTLNSQEKPQSVPDRILVKYKKQADLWIQKSIKAAIESTYGIQEIREFSFIDVYLYKIRWGKEKTLKDLNKNPNIEYAEPDYIRYIDSVVPNDLHFSKLWGLHNDGQTGGTADADIDAPEAWDLTTGSSDVIVAVIDSGVDYNHEDLNANMWTNPGEIPDNGEDDDGNGYVDDYYGINALDDNGNPMDDKGHGTHCAGIIAAVGDNDIGVVGVCWTAKIMSLKFLDAEGEGSISDEIKCIEYAIDKGAHIINASLGGPDFSYFEKNAIDASKEAGILFVTAAGNDGSNNDEEPFYPASSDCDNIIAVAATNHNDNLASFSNYGAYSVDVAGPGVSIYSTLPNNFYDYKSGTSMAAPYVAGLAALIHSYYSTPAPELSISSINWQQVKNRILSWADQIDSLEGKILTGGRINAFNSINSGDVKSYSLDIQASPFTGVYVEVSPDDLDGEGDGYTNFSRLYDPYSTVTLIAPATYSERYFGYWTVEGSKYSEEREILIKMDFNHTVAAVYPLWTLTVESIPDTNVYIEISPDDANGQGSGYTNFTREYAYGTEVTLTAPAEYSGKKFIRWFTNGTTFDDNLTTSIDIDSDYSMTAYYSDKLKWKYDVEEIYTHSSPAIGSDGTIYFGGWDKLYALNPNGTKKWEFITDSDIESSPSIGLDGTIYFGCWDKLYALNPNGTKKWEFITGDDIESSPAIGSDGTIYFGSWDQNFYALNPDGTKKWEFITGSGIESSPAIGSDGTIYFASGDDYFYALKSDSQGLANSSWPKFHHDNKNTGRAASAPDNPPSVSIISPSDGDTVSGTVMVQASAYDEREISKVEFYIDDVLKSTETISPYSYSWDTKQYSNGSYKIKVIAFDNVSQSHYDEISVDVYNYPAISGYVRTSGGSGIGDVVMSGLPDNPETGDDGYYSGTVDFGWSGTVTPTKTGYFFSPSNKIYTNVNSDQLNQDYTASLIQCTLTIAAGTGGTTDPVPGSSPYDYGTQVSVTALPNDGYEFSRWIDDVPSGHENDNPVTITMDTDKSITANFSSTQTQDTGGGDGGAKKSRCFIATAAYGSPLHPHLDILRDFRDKYLMPSKLGSKLVDLYYKYSPFVANFIADHKLLKVFVRINLLPLVVFSYSLLHLGPIITLIMFIFAPFLGVAMIWMNRRMG